MYDCIKFNLYNGPLGVYTNQFNLYNGPLGVYTNQFNLYNGPLGVYTNPFTYTHQRVHDLSSQYPLFKCSIIPSLKY